MSAIHREHPEADDLTIANLQAAALLRGGPVSDEPRVERECRDCRAPFTIPASKQDVSGKWYRLCAGCLAWEL